MNELIKGFEFALKHKLSLKDMEVLLSFMEKSQSTTQLAKEKGVNMNTIHAVITRLNLRKLIIEDSIDGRHKIYKINL